MPLTEVTEAIASLLSSVATAWAIARTWISPLLLLTEAVASP